MFWFPSVSAKPSETQVVHSNLGSVVQEREIQNTQSGVINVIKVRRQKDKFMFKS